MKSFFTVALSLATLITGSLGTVYVGQNGNGGHWTAWLDNADICDPKQFRDFGDAATESSGCFDGSCIEVNYPNPCEFEFTAPNGFSYQMINCGTGNGVPVQLVNKPDNSFNSDCYEHDKSLGCSIEQVWICA